MKHSQLISISVGTYGGVGLLFTNATHIAATPRPSLNNFSTSLAHSTGKVSNTAGKHETKLIQ